MINPVIGIISYLPVEKDIRERRLKKLKSLILSLNSIFNLPIIIIAQNYSDKDIKEVYSSNVTLHLHKRLGIVGARNMLREAFLCSKYNYLIMIDDDSKVIGSKSAGEKYLSYLEAHPDGFGEFKNSLLKLFAISKKLMKEVKFDIYLNPETGEGFEDRLFVNTLRIKFPESRFIFKNTGITEVSISTDDPDSTWYKGQDLKKMLENTEDKIEEVKH